MKDVARLAGVSSSNGTCRFANYCRV
ncbi:hypothetical protein HTQ63_20045 [Yersinia pestis subsp. pestis]|nr:hypothetical protein F1520_20885 [Yersinia pestis]MBF4414724.1 hypothetical protein [Yersinia pestis subsp. pestis]QFR87447.1 hypothetical protein DJY80_21280 [Yersinia pestis subsp. pestis bv. Medievalis]QQD42666.1 hypothetical protein AH66_020255 [Yersinia pestis EV NIIEG]KAA5774953.1 hypothetical protein F1528_20365 [Yersinia pestis]